MKGNSVTHHSLKKAYATKEEAEKVAEYIFAKGIEVHPYKCYCEQYHLTSKKER
jgi:lambda repressor-like predicted transcriptional regulator